MPLLERQAATRARAVLADLSARFLHLEPAEIPGASLAGGLAGIALVHAALEPVFPGAGHAARAELLLGAAAERLASDALSPGLYSGFPGIAWTIHHIGGGGAGDDDPCAPIDEALAAYLDHSPWLEPYDLIEGLVGLGVYAVDRLPAPSARPLVALVVARLAESAVPAPPGVTWQSHQEWLPEKYRRKDTPPFNLGVAHGVPGVIALLGRICGSRIDAATKRKARKLLDGAVAWVLAQELPKRAGACFGVGAGGGAAAVASRSAWCYGDPGVAAALLVAAQAVKEPAWESEALRIGLRAAARPVARAGAVDAGICHGAAGLGHVFHRLHRATGEAAFARAARGWLARAIAMRRARGGFAGFVSFSPGANGRLRFVPDEGFLTGAAGVALALIAATTDAEPTWDRVLLVS